MQKLLLWAATLGLPLALLLPPAALAFDLTGKWTGKWKCVVFQNGEKYPDGNSSSTADITQAANVFGALIDGRLSYSGIAIADQRNAAKGAVGIVHCGGSDDLTQGEYTELGNWKVVTKDAKGTLSGASVWSDDAQHIATCKYKYKRIDTLDPLVPTVCP